VLRGDECRCELQAISGTQGMDAQLSLGETAHGIGRDNFVPRHRERLHALEDRTHLRCAPLARALLARE